MKVYELIQELTRYDAGTDVFIKLKTADESFICDECSEIDTIPGKFIETAIDDVAIRSWDCSVIICCMG